MLMFDLYIGNKNYSSWSLRVWLLMKHFDIPFVEHMESVDGHGNNPRLKDLAGNGRVPCLHVAGFQIWESLAIAEYLAERTPDMWPADSRARARARSVSAEMHAGFTSLRSPMPMNLKFKLKGKPAAPDLQKDIDRVVAIWEEARAGFADAAGSYLFGALSIADAMFAPVVWIAAVVAGGLLSYLAIERPFLRLKSRFTRVTRPKQDPPSGSDNPRPGL